MSEPARTISIIVADDHPIFRHGLSAVIQKDPEFEIVGEAENGIQAVELAVEHAPDVAILDVDMPLMDGIETARRIRDESPGTRTVFLTMHRDRSILNSMNDLGVCGYVLKDAAMNEITECIRTIIGGSKYLSPLIGTLRADSPRTYTEQLPNFESLTKGEVRVLKLIARSRTNREIAAELFVSIRTVETHRYNICSKLDLNGPHALFKFANENRSAITALDSD